MAMSLLEADYEESGQLIECACCFGKCVFDNMAQCMEGHLVCVECLNSFAKEAVFGAATVTINKLLALLHYYLCSYVCIRVWMLSFILDSKYKWMTMTFLRIVVNIHVYQNSCPGSIPSWGQFVFKNPLLWNRHNLIHYDKMGTK